MPENITFSESDYKQYASIQQEVCFSFNYHTTYASDHAPPTKKDARKILRIQEPTTFQKAESSRLTTTLGGREF